MTAEAGSPAHPILSNADSSLAADIDSVLARVLNLKTELVSYAYHEHASPFMRRAILSSLAHAGLFNGDVEAEVGKHPNYTTAYVWPGDED